MFSSFLLVFFCSVVYSDSSFDGEWHLKRGDDIGSCNEVLKLMGVDGWKRSIMLRLDITEKLMLNKTTMHLIRETYYSHTDEYFPIGIEETRNDIILGDISQLVTVFNAQHIRTRAICKNGRGTYLSNRRLTNPTLISCGMNFTTPKGREVSCVRFYTKK